MRLKSLLVLLFSFPLFANAAVEVDSTEVALSEISRIHANPYEGSYLRVNLEKLKKQGIHVSPFCIKLVKDCYTQRMLHFHSSEFFDLGEIKNLSKIGWFVPTVEARFSSQSDLKEFRMIAKTNRVESLALIYAIDLQEKIKLGYLSAYSKKHPNRPNRKDANHEYTYEWTINLDGEIVEVETVHSSRD